MSRTLWTRTAALVAGLLVVQALMVGVFAWSAARTAPADVPLVVAGPAEATRAVAERIGQARPGAFEIEQVPGESEARAALLERDAYAAIVLTPAPRLLVASAASPTVATLVRDALGPALAAASGGVPTTLPATAPAVEDVVAADPDDPRQAVLGASLLPLVLTGMAGGALLTVVVGRRSQVFAGITAFSLLGGLFVAAILHTWLSAVPSGFAATSGVLALALLAITATVAGLGAVLRREGSPWPPSRWFSSAIRPQVCRRRPRCCRAGGAGSVSCSRPVPPARCSAGSPSSRTRRSRPHCPCSWAGSLSARVSCSSPLPRAVPA